MQRSATADSYIVRALTESQALRILSLLEQQHRDLARIIASKDAEVEIVKSENAGTVASSPPIPAQTQITSSRDGMKTGTTSSSSKSSAPPTTKRFREPMRDSSPSLAREMASRRGIPPSRAPLSVNSQSRPEKTPSEAPSRTTHAHTPRIPSSVMESQSNLPPSTQSDESFAYFYNNLTTGTMSKLSSVLAFAGLPLANEEPKEDSQTSRLIRRTVKANADPDVKKIFSRAALNAIEDDHKQRGLQGQAFGPSESFYVVQTGGGTLSYADIARASSHASEPLGGDDEEAFVDAQEALPPPPLPSPRHSRTASLPHRRDFGSARTTEELELENATLKQTLEQLASRLANFEAHAQDASMAALTQSMAGLRNQGAGTDAGPQERIKLLEKRIEQQAEQREKLEDLARKQEKKIRAYHSKWEEIKKNAREKDKAKREKQGEDGSSPK